MNERDRRTDGRTDTALRHKPRLRSMARQKANIIIRMMMIVAVNLISTSSHEFVGDTSPPSGALTRPSVCKRYDNQRITYIGNVCMSRKSVTLSHTD